MERSDFAIKLTSVILLAAMICYMIFSYVAAKSDPMKTVLAVNYTVEDSYETEGYIIRQETVLGGKESNVAVTAEEGEKISAGGTVAVAYQSTEAKDRASQIYELQIQESQINSILSADGSELESGENDAVMSLAYTVDSGNFKNMDAALLNVKTYVFQSETGYSEDELKARLSDIQQQIETLQTEADADTVPITTEQSGTFSDYIDGFENVGIDSVTDITPDTLQNLFSSPAQDGGGSLGKLITDTKWYYAAVTDFENVASSSVGDTLSVRFNSAIDGLLSMKIVNIGPETDGKCVVVLSGSRYINDLTAVRNISADVVNSSISGIRVPKEAMHLDGDNDTYVYVISGLQAEQVYVDVLGQTDDYYIVKSDDASLHDGTEIITKANDLYDGKVVEQK